MGLFGNKAQAQRFENERVRLTKHASEADVCYLKVLRRELANLIVDANPDLLIGAYDKAWTFEREITADSARAIAEEAALIAKFPMFSKLDMLGDQHFNEPFRQAVGAIPYRQAVGTKSVGDLVERYHEISRMLVFIRRRQYCFVHDERERKALYDCMGQEKDRRLRARIDDALRRAYAYQSGLGKVWTPPKVARVLVYKDNEVEVFGLWSPTDEVYGIAFKKTGDFGVHSGFLVTPGKSSVGYYRSDEAFEKMESLYPYFS